MASPVATGAAPSLSGRSLRPRGSFGPVLRLRTWLRRSQVDAEIMRGEGRSGDPVLILRESQLVAGRERRRLAARLEAVVEAPPRSRRSGSSAPVDEAAVEKASPVLTDLILLLRSRDAVTARGVALGRRLLTDPGSPLFELDEYGSSNGDRLWRESLAALEALRRP
jgi:hypothetical protein